MCLVATYLDPAAAGVEATRVCQSHVAPIELVLEHPFLSEQTRAAFHVGISHPKSFCSCSPSAACSSAYGTRGCAEGRPSPASRRMLYSRAVVLRVAYSSRRDALRAYPTRARTEPPNAVADATRCERIRNFISSDQPLRASPTSATRSLPSVSYSCTAARVRGARHTRLWSSRLEISDTSRTKRMDPGAWHRMSLTSIMSARGVWIAYRTYMFYEWRLVHCLTASTHDVDIPRPTTHRTLATTQQPTPNAPERQRQSPDSRLRPD